jgi:hypothetical protein
MENAVDLRALVLGSVVWMGEATLIDRLPEGWQQRGDSPRPLTSLGRLPAAGRARPG